MSKYIANSTQVPNAVFDEIMPKLSDAALRCYLVITRQTTGWQKSEDSISISQFAEKTGRSKPTVINGCDELEKLGLIVKIEAKNKTSKYALNLSNIFTSQESLLVKNVDNSCQESLQEVVKNLDTHKPNKPTIQKPNKKTNKKNPPEKPKPEKPKTYEQAKAVVRGITKEKLIADDLVALGVDEQVAKDWLVARKVPLTKTALIGVINQAELAKLSIAKAVQHSAENGWRGFKADWLNTGQAPPQRRDRSISAEFESWTSPNWDKPTRKREIDGVSLHELY